MDLKQRKSVLFPLAVFLLWASGAATATRQAAAVTLFPANASRDVPPDTPLRITFASAVARGSSGSIRIVDTASNQTVETIDLSATVATQSIGGMSGFNYYPVLVNGVEAAIYPRHGVLRYGRSYYVTIDSGALKDARGGFEGMAGATAWRFSTKSSPPAADASRLVVSANGDGDFSTVQGALDFLPNGNTMPRTLFIRRGTYREIVFLAGKNEITLLGEDRAETILAYSNNANFNSSGGNPFGGPNPNPGAEDPNRGGSVYRRGLLTAHRVRGDGPSDRGHSS